MKNKILTLSVATLLISLTGVSVMATMNENELNNTGSIVWDNGMNYDDIGRCQLDATIDFDIYAADDFLFEEDTIVFAYRTIAGYHGQDYRQASFNWTLEFYLDQGDGNAPCEIFTGPLMFTHEMLNPTVIEDTGSIIYYEFTFEFLEPIIFSGGQKYWTSIYGVGQVPPYSGPAFHYTPIKLNQIMGKSDYFGFPEWDNAEDINPHIDEPIDGCFQLLTFLPPSIPEINGPVEGKTGESQDYTFSSTDPEGDDITYCIDWGDGTDEICIGPFPSGDEITQSHTWSEDGSYTIQIKAQDTHGMESDYGTLEISMPKAKIHFPFSLRFLRQYPLISLLMEHLLEEK